ncbi:YqaJ viral recombinase family protein [Frigoribacterium sp. PhB24]|uniref:YqaJ viral recombinase family protein n=1 Tax=Frigoribacterium sp. PhB24 TaxID=2485204 RepID=UPI000F47FD18|nr:YqaJ viral recombinase family protein [Frigoribacterium sp. PhB24]ROS52956.1 YqaJ-like recombinase protein [Frigoribacterium sp. PhB24]
MSAAVDVLNDLEARAGASDQDRTQWLLARARGVTATEVRDLWLRRRSVSSLIAEKLTFLNAKTPDELEAAAQATFVDSKYTAWGRTREPVLAAVVQSIYPYLAPESRVFRSIENERWLGSPDGTGVDSQGQLVVSEIKTSKHDVRLGSDSYARAGYFVQMTWIMRVTGARRCLYVSEQHDSDWQDRGGEHWEPTPVGLVPVMEWVEYNSELARDLELIASEFLAALDAAMAGEVVQYDDELDTLAVNLLRFREEESSAKKAKEQTWKELQVKLRSEHDELSQESPLARITWRAAGTADVAGDPVSEVDEASLRADHPDIARELDESEKHVRAAVERSEAAWAAWHAAADKYTTTAPGEVRQVPVKESLTVTAVKNKEMKA